MTRNLNPLYRIDNPTHAKRASNSRETRDKNISQNTTNIKEFTEMKK